MDLREKLHEEGVRPLIKHREFRSIEHAHNARIEGLATASGRCVRPSSPQLSARSAMPCVREPEYGEFREVIL